MTRLAVALAVLLSCHDDPIKYVGIPEFHVCSGFDDMHIASCVAADRPFVCIAPDTDGCHQPRGVVTCTEVASPTKLHRLLEQGNPPSWPPE